MHRSSPAIVSSPEGRDGFYQDQYKEREKRFALERQEAKQKEQAKEESARIQLDKEITAMEEAIKKNNKGGNGL
jgi:LPS O-antigen subunit length determinant protein (WzzB/FepE family)